MIENPITEAWKCSSRQLFGAIIKFFCHDLRSWKGRQALTEMLSLWFTLYRGCLWKLPHPLTELTQAKEGMAP